jgi:acid phosphatase
MTFRILKHSLLLAVVLVLTACATRVPEPNLGLYKKELKTWYASGDYLTAVAQAQASAPRQIRSTGPQPTLVLDIDETSLSNWEYLNEQEFALNQTTFEKWSAKNNPPAIPATLKLFREARKAGVEVVFISGRRESMRAMTIRQLQAAGYEGWSRLVLRPESDNDPSVIPYKSSARKHLIKEGRTVVLNMGDQESDLAGGAAIHRIKLPNPFYFIP